MATTTNYSWATPDDTDLVKDGAAAIRTLGSSADTTVKNLNPGTTAGDIDYYTSGTAKARIGIGTAGQVLQVNSGATAPEWATAASGGMTLLSSAAMSGASVSVSIPAGYVNVLWIVQGAQLNASDQIFFRINGNSGGVYEASYTTRQGTSAGANYVNMVNNGTSLLIDGTCSSNTDINFTMEVINVDIAQQHAFRVFSNWVSGSGQGQQNWIGKTTDTNAVTSLSVSRLGGSATFSQGTYYLYGVK